MIEIIKKYKKTFILVLFFVLLLSLYLVREFIASRTLYYESYLNGEDYIMTPKKYGVNEYSPVNISDEQMATIYLNDFVSYLYSDINYAYQLLNVEYRNKKFGSIENFINYVDTLKTGGITIDSYSVNSGGNVFNIYTKDGNVYIFKISSVMEYEVYLDDYTVEYR